MSKDKNTDKKDKTREFFHLLSNERPTEAFWDECKKARESITSEDIMKMDELIKARKKNVCNRQGF